ncbi:MAG TPA: PH domain-containing protein [Acidimicrobiales bacterium]|nr:PH domain-containing protein [Acidimicrobiales bacterium]
MPFPRRLLNDDEEVFLDLRPHWWSMAGPSVALAAAIATAIYVATRTNKGWAGIPFLVLVLVALVWFLARMARWATTNLVVTSDRLIVRTGVIAKRGREIPLERVNDVIVTQTLFERVLRAGDLVIESAGERGREMFHECPHATQVQNQIYRQIEANTHRQAERREVRRELSPLEQLEKLDELRQRGVISQAEFDVKKAQLLDRM